jgi:hypothetical protein
MPEKNTLNKKPSHPKRVTLMEGYVPPAPPVAAKTPTKPVAKAPQPPAK